MTKAARILVGMYGDGTTGGANDPNGGGAVGMETKKAAVRMVYALLKYGLLGPLFAQWEYLEFLHQYPGYEIKQLRKRRLEKVLAKL